MNKIFVLFIAVLLTACGPFKSYPSDITEADRICAGIGWDNFEANDTVSTDRRRIEVQCKDNSRRISVYNTKGE